MKALTLLVTGGCFLSIQGAVVLGDSEPSDRLSAMDIFEMEFAADPQISPDGSKVVYVRQFADVMNDRRYSNLWIVNFDGTGHRPLTHGNRLDGSP